MIVTVTVMVVVETEAVIVIGIGNTVIEVGIDPGRIKMLMET